MRTIEYAATSTTHVPAFLTKLWKLVTDGSCDDLISWSLAGTSFIIYDEIRFSKELLPLYFKHNNMASFVRQLNMYGFRKLSCIDQGGMHCYKNEIEFYHQYFLKGQETLLELIKRKIPTSKSEEPKVKAEYVEELVASVKALRGRQEHSDSGMRYLKRENRMLWKHVNVLTERYSKQQAVLQQLLPCFLNMVRSNREIDLPLKRKAPLMIDEGDDPAKIARTTPYFEQDSDPGMPTSAGNVTNRGPVIHDVTEMECAKMYAANLTCTSAPVKECESSLSQSLESSERTIDTSFIDPGSMNALNPQFQRARSYSLGSPMELRRRPPLSSPIRLVSPGTSSSGSPPASYVQAPTIIIDEATSDVPLSAGTMTSNPFGMVIEETTSDVPITMLRSPLIEMEDSCSQHAMFNILPEEGSMMSKSPLLCVDTSVASSGGGCKSPLMSMSSSPNSNPQLLSVEAPRRNRSPSPLMQRRNSSLLTVDTSLIIGNNSPLFNSNPALINGCTSPLVSNSPPMVSANASPMMAGNSSPMMAGNSSPMMPGNSPPILINNAPSSMTGSSSPLIVVNSPPLMADNSSPLMVGNSPPLMVGNSPPLMTENSPSLMSSNPVTLMNTNMSHLMNNSQPMITINSPPPMNGNSPPMVTINSPPPMNGNSPPVMNVGMPSLVINGDSRMNQNASLLMNSSNVLPSSSIVGADGPVNAASVLMSDAASALINASSALMNDSLLKEDISPPMMNGCTGPSFRRNTAPTSMFSVRHPSQSVQATTAGVGGRFVANDSNLKAGVPEMNWLLNQDPSEPNFENWLGQIFKTDNLTPGCSLPQK